MNRSLVASFPQKLLQNTPKGSGRGRGACNWKDFSAWILRDYTENYTAGLVQPITHLHLHHSISL